MPVEAVFSSLLAIVLIALTLSVDRSLLRDQQEYLDYFVQGPSLEWLDHFKFGPDQLLFGLPVSVTEELGWRIWTALLGSLMDPWSATVLTSVAVNLGVVLAARTLRQPPLMVALWMIVPVGMVVIGHVQLRQGFAYAAFLTIALNFRKPLLALIIASTIHTTFIVPLLCYSMGRLFLRRMWQAVALSVSVAVALAVSGAILFDMFGGRRLATFDAADGAASPLYVVGALLLVVPSIWWVAVSRRGLVGAAHRDALDAIAVAHLGVTTFVVASYFVFPLGTSRVGYFTQLLALPLLASIRWTPLSVTCVIGPSLAALAYWSLRGIEDGFYSHLFG